METPTPAQLRAAVTATGSHFFTRASMKFFGDTMRNYGTRAAIVGDRVAVELYRRRPVKNGLRDSAYFDATTFERIHRDAGEELRKKWLAKALSMLAESEKPAPEGLFEMSSQQLSTLCEELR